MMQRIVITLLLLAGSTTAQQQCPLCFGDAEPNLEKTIGGAPDGPSCGSLVMDVEIDLDGCRELQKLGYQWCDCPEYPKDYFCPMCQGGFVDIPKRFKEIPGMGGKTCDDKLFVKKSSDSCADAMKPGYVCGCPDAPEPECTICGLAVEEDSKITNPEARLTINNVGSYTCQEFANQAILGSLTTEQCALVQEQAFEACGCVGSDPSESTEMGPEMGNSTEKADEPSTQVPVETDATNLPEQESAAFSTGTRGMSLVLGSLAYYSLLSL